MCTSFRILARTGWLFPTSAQCLSWSIVAIALGGATLTAQTNFTRISGGNWTTASSWSPVGVPGPADSATIVGAFDINLDASATLSNLTVSLGANTLFSDGTRVLTVLRSGSWSGGTLSNVKVKLDPTCAFTFGGGTKTLFGGTFTNAGTINWTNGQLNLENNASFYNQPGALFDAQFDGTLIQNTGGTSTFRNEGTYQKSAGANTNNIQIVSFINTGTASVSSGVLRFGTTAVAASGAGNKFQAEGGTSMVFNQANNFTNSSFSGAGFKYLATGVGEAVLSGNITATNLIFTAGTWRGAATLSGTLEWTGGTLIPQLTISAGSTLKLTGAGAKSLMNSGVITNLGSVTWTGGQFNLDNNVTFNNRPGALFDVQFDGTMIQNGGGTSTFRNDGTYRKSAGANTNTIQIVSFVNTGTTTVSNGVIRFSNTAVTAFGAGNTFHADNGAGLLFNQTCAITNSTFSGAGPKYLAVGAFEASVNGNVTATNLILTSGTWRGAATLSGSLEWTGGTLSPQLTLPAGSTLKLSGPGAKSLMNNGVITNLGSVIWTAGQFNLDNNASFYNQPGGLFDVQFDGTLIQNTSGTSTFRNDGIYRKSGGAGTNTINLVSFINPAALEINVGVIRVVGNYTPGAGSSLKTLIGGTTPGAQFGQFQVSGGTTLAGTLQLGLTNSFVPATNQTFQILTATSRSGFFNGTTGSALGGGLYLTPSYLANGVRLNVVDGLPGITNLAKVAGKFQFQLSGTVGGNYWIEATTNLVNWATISTNQIPGSGFTNFIDADSVLLPHRFYRALFVP